jgi:hypothetical protein
VEVSALRALRIAAPTQLSFGLGGAGQEPGPQHLWESLPDEVQARLLSLFARVIARSVVIEEERDDE